MEDSEEWLKGKEEEEGAGGVRVAGGVQTGAGTHVRRGPEGQERQACCVWSEARGSRVSRGAACCSVARV